MLRVFKLFAAVACGATLSACATMNVSSHVARGLDFSAYQSWQWAPPDPLPETDPRLDTGFARDHIQGAVEKELALRHIEQAPSGAPDLLVHYHANISPRIDASRANPDAGACYDEDCRVRVLESEVGTLMVDVVDAKSGRLVWRGWAQADVEGVLDNTDKLQQRIAKAITEMFKQFPRSM